MKTNVVQQFFLCVLLFFCRRVVIAYSERCYPYHGSAMNGPISHSVLFKYSVCAFKVGTTHLGQSLRLFDRSNTEYPTPMTYYEIKRFPLSKRNFPSKQSCYANRRVISGAFYCVFFFKKLLNVET